MQNSSDLLETISNVGTWRRQLRNAIRDPRILGEHLGLPPEMIDSACEAVKAGFPFLVPWAFANRMQIGDINDPLLRQIWPTLDELGEASKPDFTDDPVGDESAIVVDGLLHKYHGRVLLVTTGACAIHCRYCFRQNFAYSDVPHDLEAWRPAIEYIRTDQSINEVILSGGDPLTIVDRTLAALVSQLGSIAHVRRLRIHTRLPVVLPARVDDQLLQWLGESVLAKYIVIHANHIAELDADVVSAIARLQSAGCVVLNQAVLLQNINDTPAAQRDLCQRLIDVGVLPYYLHQLDRVAGAERFEASVSDGQTIVDYLQTVLPGYAVPKYVREVAGQRSKTPIY